MKKALVVIDFQNDFVSGSLGFEKATLLRSVIAKKIENALKEGWDLIFTMDTHGENYLETAEGKGLPIKHCIKGSWGWQLDDAVLPYVNKATKIIEKPTFGSLELGEFLRNQGYDEVELCGLVTSICVLSNAIIAKTNLPESCIVVDSNATEDLDENVRQSAFTCMKSVMVKVV